MPANISQLIRVRSQAATALIAHCRSLETKLNHNALLGVFGRADYWLRSKYPLYQAPFCRPFKPASNLHELLERERMRDVPTPFAKTADAGSSEKGHRIYAGEKGVGEKSAVAVKPELLYDVFQRTRLLGIVADPGSGKSEYLKLKALQQVRAVAEALESGRLDVSQVVPPVWVSLPEVAAAVEEERKRADCSVIERFLREHCGAGNKIAGGLDHYTRALGTVLYAAFCSSPSFGGLPVRLVWERWQRPMPIHESSICTGLLCLDAWDETPDASREEVRRHVNQLCEHLPAEHLLVSSREYGFDPTLLQTSRSAMEDSKQGREIVSISPLQTSQQAAFIRSFLDGGSATLSEALIQELERKPRVAEMAANPLLLTLLTATFTADALTRVELPARRSVIYEEMLLKLLHESERIRHPGRAKDEEAVKARLRYLEDLAWQFWPAQAFDAGKVEAHAKAWKTSPDHEEDVADMKLGASSLLDALKQDGLLATCGEGPSQIYRFLHLTFQEYLVARKLAGCINQKGWWFATITWDIQVVPLRQLLDHKAWHTAWHEIIILTAGMLTDPAPLLRSLADSTKDDILRNRLCLGAACLPEINEEELQSVSTQNIAGEIAWQIWERCQSDGIGRYYTDNKGQNLRLADLRAVTWIAIANPSLPYDRLVRWTTGLPHLERSQCLSHPDFTFADLAGFDLAFGTPKRPDAPVEIVSLVGPAIVRSRFLQYLAEGLKVWPYRAMESLTALGPAGAHTDVLEQLVLCLKGDPAGPPLLKRDALEAVWRMGAPAYTEDVMRSIEIAIEQSWNEERLDDDFWRTLLLLAQEIQTGDILRGIVRAIEESAEGQRFHNFFWRYSSRYSDGVKDNRELLTSVGEKATTYDFLISLAKFLVADVHESVTSLACRAIQGLGTAAAKPKILDCIAQRLAQPEINFGYAAANALNRMGTAGQSERICDLLAMLLQHDDWQVIREAIEAVEGIEAAAQPRFQREFLRLLEIPGNNALHKVDLALSAFRKLGKEKALPEAVFAIRRIAMGANLSVNEAEQQGSRSIWLPPCTGTAVKILEDWGFSESTVKSRTAPEEDEDAKIERLRLVLLGEDKGWGVQNRKREALHALGEIGPAAAPRIAEAISGLFDDDWHITVRDVEALLKLGIHSPPPSLLQSIARHLGSVSASSFRRNSAVACIKLLDPKQAAQQAFLAELARLLSLPKPAPDFDAKKDWDSDDPNHEIPQKIYEVLGHLGPHANTPEFYQAMLRLLRVSDENLQDRGVLALHAIKPFPSEPADPALVDAVKGLIIAATNENYGHGSWRVKAIIDCFDVPERIPDILNVISNTLPQTNPPHSTFLPALKELSRVRFFEPRHYGLKEHALQLGGWKTLRDLEALPPTTIFQKCAEPILLRIWRRFFPHEYRPWWME